MGKITEIVEQKKDKARVSVYVDGEFFCGLEKITVLSSRIKEGDEIDEESFKEIISESEERVAFDASIKKLSRRRNSEKEIERYLKQKDFSESVIQNTIAKLKEYVYINDEEFIKAYVADRKGRWGKKMLAYELSSLGVDKEKVAVYLDELDQSSEAKRLKRKYLDRHGDVPSYKVKQFLYSKGFDSDTISEAMTDEDDEDEFFSESENIDF